MCFHLSYNVYNLFSFLPYSTSLAEMLDKQCHHLILILNISHESCRLDNSLLIALGVDTTQEKNCHLGTTLGIYSVYSLNIFTGTSQAISKAWSSQGVNRVQKAEFLWVFYVFMPRFFVIFSPCLPTHQQKAECII